MGKGPKGFYLRDQRRSSATAAAVVLAIWPISFMIFPFVFSADWKEAVEVVASVEFFTSIVWSIGIALYFPFVALFLGIYLIQQNRLGGRKFVLALCCAVGLSLSHGLFFEALVFDNPGRSWGGKIFLISLMFSPPSACLVWLSLWLDYGEKPQPVLTKEND